MPTSINQFIDTVADDRVKQSAHGDSKQPPGSVSRRTRSNSNTASMGRIPPTSEQNKIKAVGGGNSPGSESSNILREGDERLPRLEEEQGEHDTVPKSGHIDSSSSSEQPTGVKVSESSLSEFSFCCY